MVLVESRRELVCDDETVDVVGHVKGHSEEIRVLADGADGGHPDSERRQRELEVRFADNVVGRRRQWWARWTSQHEAVLAPLEQEREVRTASFADAGDDDWPSS